MLTRLRQISGVQGIVEFRADPGLTITSPQLQIQGFPAAVVSCAQLASVPGLGRCPAGAAAAKVPASLTDIGGGNLAGLHLAGRGCPRPAAGQPPAGQPGRGDERVAARDRAGQDGTGERLPDRHRLAAAAETLGEDNAGDNAADNAYQQLADVVILTSLTVAGCTLAVSVAGGLADRKRPFSLLRLTGARLGMLRRVIVLESAVPLLAVAAVAIGIGFAASAMYATMEMRLSLVAPGAAYYVLTSAGIVLALGLIAGHVPAAAAHHRPGDRQKRVIRDHGTLRSAGPVRPSTGRAGSA